MASITRRLLLSLLGGLSVRSVWPLDSKPTSRSAKPSDADPSIAAPSGTNQAAVGQALYPRTEREISRGVIPTHYHHPPGNPRRYGAVGGGWAHDDTAALQNCISCNNAVIFNQGDTYGVTSITFPAGGPDVVDFNGAFVVGIATGPTDCIVSIKSSYTTFYGYQVFGLGNGSNIPNPNPNYKCATWWYNSAGGSQYNTFFGMIHSTCVRAVVYGDLPGSTPSGGLQSENSIFGFRTVGCANPFYSNAQAGFIHFSEPIFYAGFENWTVPRPRTTARALENYSGGIFAQGGELEFATIAAGFAADLQGCILQGMNFETAAPIQVIGDGVQIVGGSLYNTSSTTSEFKVAKGVTGTLSIMGAAFGRGAGAGGFSRQPMIDASDAASHFGILLQETISSEWGWALVGARCRLVIGGQVSYRNHRMHITAADPNTYILNSNPIDSIVSPLTFDNLGYTTTGWKLNVLSGGAATLCNTTSPGPPGYLASQLTLTASETAQALCGDPTNLVSMQASCLRVRPGELYWLSCWIKNETATEVGLVANSYSLQGSSVSTSTVADIASIATGTWSFVDGPLAIGDATAFLAFGVRAKSGSVSITDLRIRRAG